MRNTDHAMWASKGSLTEHLTAIRRSAGFKLNWQTRTRFLSLSLAQSVDGVMRHVIGPTGKMQYSKNYGRFWMHRLFLRLERSVPISSSPPFNSSFALEPRAKPFDFLLSSTWAHTASCLIEFKRVATLHDINSPSRHVGRIITERQTTDFLTRLLSAFMIKSNEDGRRHCQVSSALPSLLSHYARCMKFTVKPISCNGYVHWIGAVDASSGCDGTEREVYHNLDSVYPPQRGSRIAMGKRNSFETSCRGL